MAISAARLNANRRNAQRSSGPVSEAGRQKVRLNAYKHGLRAESDAVAPDEAEAVAARRAEWAELFLGGGGTRRWITEQLVLASVRIDRCQEHQRSQAAFEADRAASSWEVDREADAARLGARLAKEPDRVVSALRCSVAGVDWLLARWRGLADRLESGGDWDDAQRRLCLDLMRTPDEFRDADRELLVVLPPDERRAIVREHIAGLESLRDGAAILDDSRRGLAEVGRPTDEGSELRRLRRYESALWRRFRSLEADWKDSLAQEPEADDAPDTGPIDDPSPPSRATVPGPLAVAPPPEPRPHAGPPGPRPDRTARRANPTPPPPPPPARDVPASTAPPARMSPSIANVALPGSSGPAVMLNRRARRALKKANKRS